ncbi:MAG TPA: DUF4252 domain-containing protein [Acidobacteriaceae bacterium]|jgi:hypothetical protein|nr:DUF4252 domain-containing protein [Acidobacteriaceae bacterium]
MITPVLPIAVLAASFLASPPLPAVTVIVPSSPVLMQLTQVSMFADGQTVTSSGGQTVSTSSDGKTVTTSSGRKVVSISSGAQTKDELFAGTEKFAQGASESTEINLDPDTMAMMDSHHKNAELAKKMKFMTVRTYEYDKPGMYKMEDVEVFRKKLEDGTWKCSVRVREKNESTDICSRIGPDHETREMVILTAEPKELTFIHMSGNMSLDDLNKAANGLQHR